METYSTVSGDYQMFDDKMPIDSENTDKPSDVEMVRYMFRLLDEYNRSINAGQEPAINPLNGRVTMKLRNGQVYEIPERIQRFAIYRYVQASNNTSLRQQGQTQVPVQRTTETQETTTTSSEETDKKNKMFTNVVVILLIVAIAYLLYRYFTEEDNDLDF